MPDETKAGATHGEKTLIGHNGLETLVFERPKLKVRVTLISKFACVKPLEYGATVAARPEGLVEGEAGLPLAAWLRPGKQCASAGAVDVLQEVVERLRSQWPGIPIFVRGDCGLACPEMYEYYESQGLFYTFGHATNEVLKRV